MANLWMLWTFFIIVAIFHLGAQLVLSNPLSTIIATITAWRFFAERIPEVRSV